MPILDINDEVYVNKEDKEEKRVYRTQEEMKTSILFNKDHKLDTIIQYPKGMKWEVSYFLQIRDLNDSIQPPDPQVPATIQKYHRINKLIINLQSPISHDNIENITGEAIINSGFLPNVHDVFIATLTGGREAMFIITEIQTRTYNLHRAYYATFKIFMFLDTEPDRYNDILKKTMKEYYYDKEHLLDYSAPVILQQDYKKKLELRDAVHELIDYYFTKFVNKEKQVIALPTETGVYVDTMLNDFIFKIINRTDHIAIAKLASIDYVPDDDLIGCTIWDLIYKRDKSILKRLVKHVGFKYTPYYYNNVVNRKMNVLGIKFIANKLSQFEERTNPSNIKDLSIKPYPKDYKLPINTEYRSYVVSEEFYDPECITYTGLLEKLLADYIDSKILDANELETLVQQYMHWDTIDQYYLIPILIVLVKDSISHTFKSL